MSLGFIGTGTITASIVEGLRAAGSQVPIRLSPRNAELAAALAAKYDGVSVETSNQAVVDQSQMVVVAVRPQIVDEVLRGLRFRPEHHVLSLVATVSLDYLSGVTAPAAKVTRAVPLPSVSRRQGPTAIFPADPQVAVLFDALGAAVPLAEEAQFDIFTSATGMMASYFAYAGAISDWMERGGVSPEKARGFVAQMLKGLASAAGPGCDFDVLAEEHQTRGGLNEQVVRALTADGAFTSVDRALGAVLERLRAGATVGGPRSS